MVTGSRSGKLKVAVLMGGLSSERDISLSTGKQIMDALDRTKYEVCGVDAALMPGSTLRTNRGSDCKVDAVSRASKELFSSAQLHSMDVLLDSSSMRPDVVFIALHGKYGEDGCVQGLLEILGLPYTGSGVLASALAMDKTMAKQVMSDVGIPVPPSFEITSRRGRSDMSAVQEKAHELQYPLIVKPSRQGSTIGMTKVTDPACLGDAIHFAFDYDSRVLVEKFIEGIELTVSVLGNEDAVALPVIEIVPASGFYDYEAKYTPGATDEIVPARIPDNVRDDLQDLAVRAHLAIGCRGISRVDFIYDAPNCYTLEINTIPGMTPTSLLPRAAAAEGIEFSRLLDTMIELAMQDAEEFV